MSIQNAFINNWIQITPSEEILFEKFLGLFKEYNSHTNLSAIRDEEGIIEKHFVDSVMLDLFTQVKGRVLDIGTGWWFPGIPLKIRHPDTEFVLLDSVGKKIRACEHFIRELSLEKIGCIHGRAEEVVKDAKYFHGFDFVVSRATAYLPKILEWAEPFLGPSGTIILFKLPSQEELADGVKIAKKLGLVHSRSEAYSLAWQERVLLYFSRGVK